MSPNYLDEDDPNQPKPQSFLQQAPQQPGSPEQAPQNGGDTSGAGAQPSFGAPAASNTGFQPLPAQAPSMGNAAQSTGASSRLMQSSPQQPPPQQPPPQQPQQQPGFGGSVAPAPHPQNGQPGGMSPQTRNQNQQMGRRYYGE